MTISMTSMQALRAGVYMILVGLKTIFTGGEVQIDIKEEDIK